jgi:hypothetical protein
MEGGASEAARERRAKRAQKEEVLRCAAGAKGAQEKERRLLARSVAPPTRSNTGVGAASNKRLQELEERAEKWHALAEKYETEIKKKDAEIAELKLQLGADTDTVRGGSTEY